MALEKLLLDGSETGGTAGAKINLAIDEVNSQLSQYGELSEGSTALDFTPGEYQPLENYTVSDGLLLSVDPILGEIVIPLGATGKYRTSINLVANFDLIGNTNETMTLGIFNGINYIREITTDIIRDGSSWSFTASALEDLIEGMTYAVHLKSSYPLSNITFGLSGFDIESVHLG